MNPTTLEQLQSLVSVSSQIALIGKDANLEDFAVVQNLLALNRELVKVTGPIQAYSKYANSVA